MDIYVKVIGQKMHIPTNLKTIITGQRNFVKLVFMLPDYWSSLTSHARFLQSDNAYDVSLDDDNSCYIPSVIEPGECTLTLYGVGGSGGSIIAVTNDIDLNFKGSSFDPTDEDNIDQYEDDYIATVDEALDYLNIDEYGSSDNIATVEETLNYINS